MLNVIEIVLPLLMLIVISIPLFKVFKGNTTVRQAKSRLVFHITGFFGVVLLVIVMQMIVPLEVFAEETEETTLDLMTGTLAQGLGFISAALATGMSALGAGIAVAAAAPAAIGAFSENEKNFGKSLIFVALGEGVAIYGLLISILIINKL